MVVVVPPFHTPKWWFLVGKPMVVGETHHFRKPPYLSHFGFRVVGFRVASFFPPHGHRQNLQALGQALAENQCIEELDLQLLSWRAHNFKNEMWIASQVTKGFLYGFFGEVPRFFWLTCWMTHEKLDSTICTCIFITGFYTWISLATYYVSLV